MIALMLLESVTGWYNFQSRHQDMKSEIRLREVYAKFVMAIWKTDSMSSRPLSQHKD